MSLQQGKIALVTGAAGGIGLCIATELLRNDAEAVVLADINEELGQKALKQLYEEFDPSRAIFVKLDVTSDQEFEEAFQKTISTYGNVDIVVNNAGVICEKDYIKTININFTGTLRGTTLALKYMSQGGIVLNISSLAAVTQYMSPVYSATKAAVLSLSLNYGKALYYEKTKVKVITLCPGYTTTGLMENYKPEDEYLEQTADEVFNIHPRQKADSVAKAAIYAITNGSSGSCWGINDGKLSKASLPDWAQYFKLIDDNF